MPQITILVMGGNKKKPLGSEKSARASEGENLVKKEETKKPAKPVRTHARSKKAG